MLLTSEQTANPMRINNPYKLTFSSLLELPFDSWDLSEFSGTKLWMRHQSLNLSALHRKLFKCRLDRDKLAAVVADISGHFGLVFQGGDEAFAASDACNTALILFGYDGQSKQHYFGQSGAAIVDQLELTDRDTSSIGALSIALSGYTIGTNTLYESVRALAPGTLIYLKHGQTPTECSTHQFRPWEAQPLKWDRLKSELSEELRAMFERLIQSAAGRPIVVPLSAGLDSRVLVAGLKEFGYKNVKCFAYGLSGNHEALASKRIAEALGYSWEFVPYTNQRQKAVYQSEEHREYVTFADTLTGVHFEQEFLALRELRETGWLEGDAIILNGQSGDFISGNHIPTKFFTASTDDVQERKRLIVNELIERHFKLWRSVATEDSHSLVAERLTRELGQFDPFPDDPSLDYGLYEWSEFKDRQSKYVVQNVRLYEFFKFDWRMPLWDREFMDFWAKAPLSAKKNQALYRETLRDLDWGGVWHSVPVNLRNIRPMWIRPLRLALKALHAPVGKQKWHQFERRYLTYWTNNLCSTAHIPYARITRDTRGAWGAVSWWTEKYLARRGLSLETVLERSATQ